MEKEVGLSRSLVLVSIGGVCELAFNISNPTCLE